MGMTRGFTNGGIEALHRSLLRHVERGNLPGLVALVARGDQAHVEAIGHKAFGDSQPIERDAIFRIASVTKPIAGVAAMLLLQEGVIALEDPIARWLPELAGQRVLRALTSDLDDTVPTERSVTVEDILSFHLGFGSIMTAGDSPVQRAEAQLGLKTLGPPWPPVDFTLDDWVARFGRLPLLEQPGAAWRYNTGATLAGALIERVAGTPLAEVLRERVFEPLGMVDTAFYVPADKLERFTTFYAVDDASGGLEVFDRPAGWWSRPPKMADASAGLVSTADDLWAFASMLASGGGDLLSLESVRLMTLDRMTASERAQNNIFVGDHSGWGLMMSVPAGDGSTGIPGGYGWDGGSGTAWRTDTSVGLTGILLTQRMATSPEAAETVTDFWHAAYAAIED
jgi:CubicO group peptidase (beta-lactamase class C family)